MKEIFSSRKWRFIYPLNLETIIDEEITINEIHSKIEDEETEMDYAIQDRMDELLDMRKGDSIFFQFHRDDDSQKGIVIRTK